MTHASRVTQGQIIISAASGMTALVIENAPVGDGTESYDELLKFARLLVFELPVIAWRCDANAIDEGMHPVFPHIPNTESQPFYCLSDGHGKYLSPNDITPVSREDAINELAQCIVDISDHRNK